MPCSGCERRRKALAKLMNQKADDIAKAREKMRDRLQKMKERNTSGG